MMGVPSPWKKLPVSIYICIPPMYHTGRYLVLNCILGLTIIIVINIFLLTFIGILFFGIHGNYYVWPSRGLWRWNNKSTIMEVEWLIVSVSAFAVSPILLNLFLYSPEVIQYLVAGDTKDIFLWNVSVTSLCVMCNQENAVYHSFSWNQAHPRPWFCCWF